MKFCACKETGTMNSSLYLKTLAFAMPIVEKNLVSHPRVREIFGLSSERLSSISKYVLHDNRVSLVDKKGKTDHTTIKGAKRSVS